MSKRSTYGRVAKLGVIIPPNNLANEVEFHAMAPPGVSAHFTRLPIHMDTSAAGTAAFYRDLQGATRLLAEAEPDVMLYACTIGSILFPASTICDRMRAVAGVPGVATASAVLAALRALGARRVALVTPYDEALTLHEKEWLEHEGFAVPGLAFHGFGPPDFLKLKRLGPEDAVALVDRAAPAAGDAIFISCADFACAEAIETIERRHGRPAVTSNQASFWAALRAAGYDAPVPGYGQLLRLDGSLTTPSHSGTEMV